VTRRRAVAALLLLLLAAVAPEAGASADAPAGEDSILVRPQPREGMILVSFSSDRAIEASVQRAIESGLPTTFTYDVELRRPSWFWFDKLIASARIAVTVRYDTLTRTYHVTLLQDGRVAEARSTEHAEEVKRWVSVFQALPLFPTRELRERTEYYVRVHGRTSPRNTWSFWPWSRPAAHGSASFTFTP
jgi:hypothetical protein